VEFVEKTADHRTTAPKTKLHANPVHHDQGFGPELQPDLDALITGDIWGLIIHLNARCIAGFAAVIQEPAGCLTALPPIQPAVA